MIFCYSSLNELRDVLYLISYRIYMLNVWYKKSENIPTDFMQNLSLSLKNEKDLYEQ